MINVNIIDCDGVTIYLPSKAKVDSVQFIDLYRKASKRGMDRGRALSWTMQKMGV